MDFDIKKPSHIFALLMLIIVLLVTFVIPILSFFGILPSSQAGMIEVPDSVRVMFEVVVLLLQITLFLILPFVVAFIWYHLVNKLTVKEIFASLKLRSERIDIAFLWGIVAAFSMFAIAVTIGLLLTYFGFQVEDLGNVEELLQYFSYPTIFSLIVFQSIGEEIFFRGFLLEKIDSLAGKNMAIFGTAILFGLAHMGYGKLFPVILPIIMGIILGYIVIKTKNLYASIIAHMIFNLVVLILAILAIEIMQQTALTL